MSAATPTDARPASSRWLFGPVPDLLLGCGVGYAFLFALQLFDPSLLRAWVPAGAAPLVILVSGTPHYGATLLRVYERAEDRRAYAFFTVWITGALVALFFAGITSAFIGSLLLTVYLTWSPWHYSGQNYGVALMLLGRRGVAVGPRAKRCFHATFFLSFVLTFLAQHGTGGGPGYAPFADGGDAVRFLPLGIPGDVAGAGMVVAGIAYALLLIFAFGSFLRSGSLGDVAPAAILTATQSLWFVAPVLIRHWKLFPDAAPFAPSSGTYAFLWIAAGHSVQYLWVTTFYAARTAGAAGRTRYLAKSLLAGAAIWNVPILLFGAAGLGWSASSAGLASVVAAVVNLHHFLLDGAIWKLRDGRVAQILIRARQANAGSDGVALAPARGVPWFRSLVWLAGVICVAFVLARTYEREVGLRVSLEKGNLRRAEQAADRLATLGLDAAETRLALARAAVQLKRSSAAQEQLQRSLALRPTVPAYVQLGVLREEDGDFAGAASAYQSALELEPDDVEALHRRGVALLGLGRAEEAEKVLARAASLAPDQKLIAMNLARARARAGAPAPPPAGTAIGSPATNAAPAPAY